MYRIVVLVVVSLVFVMVVIYIVPSRVSVPDVLVGVQRLGHIAIGGEAVAGRGGHTFAPYFEIPLAKFYVTVLDHDIWCSNEDCSLDGALIETMGGWLQAEMTCCGSEIKHEIGLDLPEQKEVKTLVVVSDSTNKVVGIYPNRGLADVLPVLRLHPDLADFSLLEGVREFGILKVGQPAPLQPGDSLAQFGDEPPRHSITQIPKGKKFYLYAVQKRKYDMVGMTPWPSESHPFENTYQCFIGSCRYPEPDPPHDFLFAYIEDLGGWFFSNDEANDALPPLFGLAQDDVLQGTSSLVVLTDAKGIIVAIHPNKTLSDALTILSQHPDLADMRKIFGS